MRTVASCTDEGPLVADWNYGGTAEDCCKCIPGRACVERIVDHHAALIAPRHLRLLILLPPRRTPHGTKFATQLLSLSPVPTIVPHSPRPPPFPPITPFSRTFGNSGGFGIGNHGLLKQVTTASPFPGNAIHVVQSLAPPPPPFPCASSRAVRVYI